VARNKELDAAVQILTQGLEFYPESAELAYKITGVLLMLNDPVQAKERFTRALQSDYSKLDIFKKAYPKYYHSEWAQNIISVVQNASK